MTSQNDQPESQDLASTVRSTRRGLLAVVGAVAAYAGFRAAPAKATSNTTINAASTSQIGLLASTGTVGAPIEPAIGSTTHSIIGSQSSLTTPPLSSGVFGARNGNGLAGVLGVNGSNGIGVMGQSDSGIGVFGKSTSASGVFGESTNDAGVTGQSQELHGVLGTSVNRNGVRASSTNGIGVLADSGNSHGVFAITTKPGSAAVRGQSKAASNKVAGLFEGNVRVVGDFAVTGAKAAAVPMPDGTLVTMYCQESPDPWFEDFGRARLEGGRARVPLDADFAALVRLDGYMVFAMPEGPTAGLYVHARDDEGFEIRELGDGRGTLDFTFRIVARRKDIDGPRLKPLDEVLVGAVDDPVEVMTANLRPDPNHIEV